MFGHELMVLERCQAGAEATAQLIRHGNLQDASVLPCVYPAALPQLIALEGFEKEGLAGPAAVQEQPGGLTHRHGRLLGIEDQGEPGLRRFSRHQEIQALQADCPEIVFRLVEEPVGAGLQAGHCHPGLAFLIMFDCPLGRLGSVLPKIEDGFRRRGRLPARPQPVSGCFKLQGIFI